MIISMINICMISCNQQVVGRNGNRLLPQVFGSNINPGVDIVGKTLFEYQY